MAGVYDRIAAFVLAGFCVVTAFLYHPFWAYPDFWIESDSSQAREHFWQFLKNFGLVGGLLLVVFAGISPRPRRCCARRSRLAGMPLPPCRSRRYDMEAHGWCRSVTSAMCSALCRGRSSSRGHEGQPKRAVSGGAARPCSAALEPAHRRRRPARESRTSCSSWMRHRLDAAEIVTAKIVVLGLAGAFASQ